MRNRERATRARTAVVVVVVVGKRWDAGRQNVVMDVKCTRTRAKPDAASFDVLKIAAGE